MISIKGSVVPTVLANEKEKMLRLTDVYYAIGVRHNLISYSILDKKGNIPWGSRMASAS